MNRRPMPRLAVAPPPRRVRALARAVRRATPWVALAAAWLLSNHCSPSVAPGDVAGADSGASPSPGASTGGAPSGRPASGGADAASDGPAAAADAAAVVTPAPVKVSADGGC